MVKVPGLRDLRLSAIQSQAGIQSHAVPQRGKGNEKGTSQLKVVKVIRAENDAQVDFPEVGTRFLSVMTKARSAWAFRPQVFQYIW